ncbi:hypothetical protein QCA50_018139 [Cerrena zonata]|uniref:Uncharacterized protein n=1 Tax=Cerrena zonata TaxID=2478898 RepID=A0AAW0FNH3_9APHY
MSVVFYRTSVYGSLISPTGSVSCGVASARFSIRWRSVARRPKAGSASPPSGSSAPPSADPFAQDPGPATRGTKNAVQYLSR